LLGLEKNEKKMIENNYFNENKNFEIIKFKNIPISRTGINAEI